MLGGIAQLNKNIGNNKGQYLPLPRWYLHWLFNVGTPSNWLKVLKLGPACKNGMQKQILFQ